MASNGDILSRLDALQKSFHPALREGGRALELFHSSFDSLINDPALHTAHERTQGRVRSFVDTVKTVSSALLDIETATQIIHEETRIRFENLSLSDISQRENQAPYIECCYTWLLGHLHNPYPSKAIREQFAHQAGAREKDVDSWFIEARKRIGWNEIRRAYFDTRFDMIKAATRHFHPTSRRVRRGADNLSLPDDKELIDYSYHFVTMENNARGWYSHNFFPTSLATNLERSIKQSRSQQDAALSYPSPRRTPSCERDKPAPSTSVLERRKRRRSSDADSEFAFNEESSRRHRPFKRTRLTTPSTTYAASSSSLPSPAPSVRREHSLSMSPPVAPFLLEEEELSVATTQLEKRKRCPSNASDYDSDSSRAPRARRRRRLAEHDSELETLRKVSTPKRLQMSDTSRELPLSHAGTSSQLPTVPMPSESQTLKRKRRLSDAQDQRPRKLPHHVALSVPRMHTVSNPLPAPSLSLDLEDIPTTLSAEVPTLSNTVDFGNLQNLDIESFDYGTMPALKDYLSQSNLVSGSIDYSDASNSVTFVASETPFSSQSSSTDALALFNLDFASPNQLSLSAYDGLYSDIQSAAHTLAPQIMQNFSSTTDKLSTTLGQTFDPTFHHNTSSFLMQSSGVNPFDLMLYPSTNIPPTHGANADMAADHSSLSSGSAFVNGETSQATLALQRIQALQAELEMYKNQLTQSGVFTF